MEDTETLGWTDGFAHLIDLTVGERLRQAGACQAYRPAMPQRPAYCGSVAPLTATNLFIIREMNDAI